MELASTVEYEALESAIRELVGRSSTRLVAIDGRGGAGKSTLAGKLAAGIGQAVIVAVDDFWLPSSERPSRECVIAEPGSDYDWTRLRDHVLVPLTQDKPVTYQRYDWQADTLAECHDIPVGGTVIVEGVFSTRSELDPLYDAKIWLETPEDLCVERGYARDGEAGRELWDMEWMPAYRAYVAQTEPMKRADFIFEGL